MKKYLIAVIVSGFALSGCDDIKNTAREISNDRCSASEISARLSELGADQMDQIGQMSGSDSTEAIDSMSRSSNRYSSGVARVTAALMRGDLDTACKLADELEAETKGQ